MKLSKLKNGVIIPHDPPPAFIAGLAAVTANQRAATGADVAVEYQWVHNFNEGRMPHQGEWSLVLLTEGFPKIPIIPSLFYSLKDDKVEIAPLSATFFASDELDMNVRKGQALELAEKMKRSVALIESDVLTSDGKGGLMPQSEVNDDINAKQLREMEEKVVRAQAKLDALRKQQSDLLNHQSSPSKSVVSLVDSDDDESESEDVVEGTPAKTPPTAVMVVPETPSPERQRAGAEGTPLTTFVNDVDGSGLQAMINENIKRAKFVSPGH